jgi:peptidoglycan/LPS O-acetylase OafA/YrhL
VPFVLGSALAYVIEGQKLPIKFSERATYAIVLIAIILLSFDRFYPAVAGAFLVMLALLGNDALSTRLSGPVSALVGKLSFPLYLVHTLVLLSISSTFFSRMVDLGVARPIVLIETLCVTLLAALVLCLPLVYVESWWVPWLNRFTRKAVATAADIVGARTARTVDGHQTNTRTDPLELAPERGPRNPVP